MRWLKPELAPGQQEVNDGPIRTEDDHRSPATHWTEASGCDSERRNGKPEQPQTGLLGDGLCRQPQAQGMPDLRQLSAELNMPALDPTLNAF